MTKQQKKDVRKALRRYGRTPEGGGAEKDAWGRVIRQTMEYYALADPVCAALLQRRYLEGGSEWEVVEALHIGRTTYYRKELEALSTLAVYAARAGLV